MTPKLRARRDPNQGSRGDLAAQPAARRARSKRAAPIPDSARAQVRATFRTMAGGSILLGDVAARTATIEITCRVCPRRGSLHTDRLLAEHGPAMGMPELLRILAGDCPRLGASAVYERCDVHCLTLSELFMPIGRPV